MSTVNYEDYLLMARMGVDGDVHESRARWLWLNGLDLADAIYDLQRVADHHVVEAVA